MIHVLHVVPMLAVGGVELALARVARGLGAPAFRHSVACLTGQPIIADHFAGVATVHCLNGDVDPFGQVWRLRRLIQTLRPSVVHARNVSSWFDVAVTRLSLARRPPLVLSFHGTDRAGALSSRARLMAAFAARSAAHVFTVSERSRSFLSGTLRVPADRLGLIPNGVDMRRFAPHPDRHGDASRFHVGTVGNLSPVKNQTVLVRACAELRRAGHDVIVSIAGEGSERRRLADAAASLGVSEFVHLRGHVDDVPAFLQSLDLFVLPSDSEAHPNALVEAMACGLPCVASRVGGIPDVITDDSVGRLFERGDVGGLVNVVADLIAAPDTRAALGRGARKRAEERYGLDEMMRRYTDLYTRVAG